MRFRRWAGDAGGEHTYAAGGYYGTPVGRLLPVTRNVKSTVKIPSLAVTYVLDRSGSMGSKSQGEEKIDIAKKATMTDPAVAERRSGYVLGGISPFGQKHLCPTFVDEWATALDVIHCSGGRRGLEIAVAPAVFAEVLDATFVPIAAWDHV